MMVQKQVVGQADEHQKWKEEEEEQEKDNKNKMSGKK